LKCDYKTLKKFQIARENPEIEREMLVAVEEVLNTGQAMSAAAREFANDPCSSVKRGNMVGHQKLLKFL
jgi:catenin alpha